MLVHRRVTPSIKFAGIPLYTWVERGTVRVKCLAQEHNTMSPARARTQTARSRDERTNHEATVPPTNTLKGTAKAPAVDLLRLNTLRATKTAFLTLGFSVIILREVRTFQ